MKGGRSNSIVQNLHASVARSMTRQEVKGNTQVVDAINLEWKKLRDNRYNAIEQKAKEVEQTGTWANML